MLVPEWRTADPSPSLPRQAGTGRSGPTARRGRRDDKKERVAERRGPSLKERAVDGAVGNDNPPWISTRSFFFEIKKKVTTTQDDGFAEGLSLIGWVGENTMIQKSYSLLDQSGNFSRITTVRSRESNTSSTFRRRSGSIFSVSSHFCTTACASALFWPSMKAVHGHGLRRASNP
jgi:hypothetical protein